MSVNSLRNEIFRIDDEIAALLDRRFELLQELKTSGSEDNRIYAGAEEVAQALKDLLAPPRKSVPPETLTAVFREIFSKAWELQEPVKVAFLGQVATFTHQAALARFGSGVRFLPQKTIADVFDAVTRGSVSYGVVPVENSTEGAVTYTLDMFADAEVNICAEVNMVIHHNLLCTGAPSELRTIYSHPQVFGQCRQWLQKNLPAVNLVEVSSTTEAARRCVTEECAGALASALAAEQYGIPIREKNIEDYTGNTTRFMVLGRQMPPPTGDDKTSIMFVIRHQPGALYDSLLPLREYGINLTFIESRPSKQRNWEYFFFVDFLGHASEDNVRMALKGLGEHCQYLKILGSYPRAQL